MSPFVRKDTGETVMDAVIESLNKAALYNRDVQPKILTSSIFLSTLHSFVKCVGLTSVFKRYLLIYGRIFAQVLPPFSYTGRANRLRNYKWMSPILIK